MEHDNIYKAMLVLKTSHIVMFRATMLAFAFYQFKRIFKSDSSPSKLSFPYSGDYIEVYRELGRELADVRVQVNYQKLVGIDNFTEGSWGGSNG